MVTMGYRKKQKQNKKAKKKTNKQLNSHPPLSLIGQEAGNMLV